MKNKGVTLISLVVTIIVLLILAGITIGTIFDDNGIIKKAKEAANATEEAAKNDQAAINGLLNEMDSIINGIGGGNVPVIGSINGKITWSTGSATLTLTTDVEGVTIQYRKNSESNWTNYTSAVPSLLHGDKVYARGIKDGEMVINEKEFKIQDTIAPTVTIANTSSTTNSISVTATATDNEAGMGSSPQYTFYIKKTAEADSTYTQIGSSTSTSITKGELEQNTSYTIKVEVTDVAGNKGQATKEITTGKIADAGEGLTNGAIIASSPVWSGGTASITLSTNSGLTIQYQKNGINGNWTTGTNVVGLRHGDIIFARLTDGKNYGGEASITILDAIAPTVTIENTSSTTNSISVTATATDNESGMGSSPQYTFYIKKTTEADSTYTQIGSSASTSITKGELEQNTSYTIKAEVTDVAGNKGQKTKGITTGKIADAGEGLTNGAIIASSPVWSGGTASITLSTNSGLTIQYQKNGINGNWTTGTNVVGLRHGDIIFARLTDGKNYGGEASITILDAVAPTVTIASTSSTTDSISVTATATDNEAGMGSSPQYTFYIKKTAEVDSAYMQIGSSASTSVTKGGLEQKTSYTIKVEVADIAGNKGQATKEITTGKIADAGEGLTNGAIIASSPVWSNGTASLTLSTNSGLTIQYQKGGVSGSWTTGTNVTGLHHRDTVFARLTDGKNYGGEASITILDTEIPQDAEIKLSGASTTTEGSVTATVTLKDNESGVNPTASKWVYNTNSGNIGTSESSYNNNFSSNGQTITLKETTAGTYYLHVLTVDNAKNKKETISSAITVKKELVADGSYNEEKGVNTPKLGTGMTPIKWNGSSWIETTGSDPEWYDYTAKKWANAMTEDGSMWVWIPRYAYSITSGYHSSNVGNIEVEFLKGTSNETSTGRTTFINASGQRNWNIHPAFNYGTTVSGLWIAKFEASSVEGNSNNNSGDNVTSKTLQVKPGVASWRYIDIENMYTVCLKYNRTLNSHMMKNDEWGAVAYLSKSKYGKNAEVDINNNGSYYTGGGGGNTYINNVGQSTTGTIEGIYDMSGGSWEYVAAYVNTGHVNLQFGSALVNGDEKTKNMYSNGYGSSSEKYGDAVYETSTSNNGNTSWNSDYSKFPHDDWPFFVRGGKYSDGEHAGMFYFDYYYGGNSFNHYSFRPVLIVL